MAAKSTRGRIGARVVPAKRLARAQRREDLLDAAVQLILSGGVEAVSMETVADRAGVSRPLVYRKWGRRAPDLQSGDEWPPAEVLASAGGLWYTGLRTSVPYPEEGAA